MSWVHVVSSLDACLTSQDSVMRKFELLSLSKRCIPSKCHKLWHSQGHCIPSLITKGAADTDGSDAQALDAHPLPYHVPLCPMLYPTPPCRLLALRPFGVACRCRGVPGLSNENTHVTGGHFSGIHLGSLPSIYRRFERTRNRPQPQHIKQRHPHQQSSVCPITGGLPVDEILTTPATLVPK